MGTSRDLLNSKEIPTIKLSKHGEEIKNGQEEDQKEIENFIQNRNRESGNLEDKHATGVNVSENSKINVDPELKSQNTKVLFSKVKTIYQENALSHINKSNEELNNNELLSSYRSNKRPEESKEVKLLSPQINNSLMINKFRSVIQNCEPKTKIDFKNFKIIRSMVKEENDFIFPCKCRQPAHRCCVAAISMIRKKITCPFCEDYFRYEAKRKSVFNEANRKILISMMCKCMSISLMIITCIVLIALNIP